VATFKNNLAMALDAGGEDARAEELFREALVFQEEALGPSHPDLATYRRNLGGVLADLGRHEEARASYGRALDILTSHFGREHGRVATCLHDLARVQIALGRLDDAEAGLRSAIGIHRRIHDDNTRNLTLGGSLERLASVAYARKDFERAAALLTEALAIARRAQGREHVHARELMTGLAGVLREAGRYDEAARLAEEAYALDERLDGDAHPSTRKTVQTLVEIYEGWEKPEECAAWRARLD
jgi:tetratricopeptide (TPR) repeat protein